MRHREPYRLWCLIVGMLVVYAAVLPVMGAAAAGSSVPSGFELVAENQFLALYINRSTTEIAVEQKNDAGTIWYSNPPGAAKSNKLQLSITYYLPGDIKMSMDSYNHSVAFDQYTISELENGVRVDYTLGKEWRDEDYIPTMISEERFGSLILDRIENTRDRSLFEKNYTLLALEKRGEEEVLPQVYQVDTSRLLGDNAVVILKTRNSRLRGEKEAIELLVDQVVASRGDVRGRMDVTPSHIVQLASTPTYVLNAGVSAWDKQDMSEILKMIGYTPEQVIEDHEDYGLRTPVRNIEVFDVPIEYTIEGDSFIASIPASEVVYPVDVVNQSGKTVTLPVTDIGLLRYFGAASQEDEGYMFVPDGSGALIELNNGKISAAPYRRAVYGDDTSNKGVYSQTGGSGEVPKENVYLPVFGMRRNQSAFLGIIEDADSLAKINADISGRTGPYNTVYAEFSIIPFAEVWIEKSDSIGWINERVSTRRAANSYQSRTYQGNLRVRYVFLNGEDADYVGMAHRYRDYLVRNTGMSRLSREGDIPLFLELVGAMFKNKPVLGLPRQVIEPLTTFRDVQAIVSRVLENGVTSIRLRYSGWLDGGLRHVFPSGVKLEEKLGSDSEFRALAEFLRSEGISFYPDVSFLNVYRDELFDGFSAASDAARRLDRSAAKSVSMVEGECFVLSPRRLPSLIDSYMSGYEGYGIDGLSLRHMGTQLNSDFRTDVDELVDRQQALGVHAQQLSKLSERMGLSLMLSGANAYAIHFAGSIINLSLDTSYFTITDRAVPFYQIVVHGFVDYAGEPINLAQNRKRNVLKTIETGAYPYYVGFYREGSVVKNSQFSHLYSAYYEDWLDDALQFYEEVNMVLRDVQDRLIIDHEQLAEGVFKTTYEGGRAIITNYNGAAVEIDGVVVGAESFRLVEEGGI